MAASTNPGTAPRPGTSKRTCRSCSSTTSPSTTPLPFYYVYGGTQDNQSLGGPSRTRSASGIINTDWFMTAGGDGFRSQVDPVDPNTVYAESQNGGLIRFDRATGNFVGIQPQDPEGGPPNRWNWDSPIYVSSHVHTRLYFAANRIYRSDDRGDSWKLISPDLSRQIDRNSLPVMGKVWGPDAVAKNASTEFYGNIVAFAESPKDENLLFAGTDDGLIHVTHDGGASWSKIEHFPGVPDNTYVSRLIASNYDTNVVYAAFDNHKNSDFKPYLLKSVDGGKTWSSIAANLPERGQVMAIAEDPVDRNLLFAGTEFGVFFSSNARRKVDSVQGRHADHRHARCRDPGSRRRSRACQLRPRLLYPRRHLASARHVARQTQSTGDALPAPPLAALSAKHSRSVAITKLRKASRSTPPPTRPTASPSLIS